jgi:hypothetical protein
MPPAGYDPSVLLFYIPYTISMKKKIGWNFLNAIPDTDYPLSGSEKIF